MTRWMIAVVVCAALVVGIGLGLSAARAIQSVSYDMGRLTASAEWYRQVQQIEASLNRGEDTIVGDWKVSVVTLDDHKTARAKKRKTRPTPTIRMTATPVAGQ